MVRLEIPALEQISAGLIQVAQRRGQLYPYPQNLQLGYDKVVLSFLLSEEPERVPSSLPDFYRQWCEKPFSEWNVEVDAEIDVENTLLFFGEPTEITIELAEAFGGSVFSQEQSRIASTLLQRCQSHSQGVQLYTKFRRFIIEHPVLTEQEFVEAKGLFGLGVGLADLLEECYEPAPGCHQWQGNFYACPYCHALTAVAYEQVIANPDCNRCLSGRRLKRKIKLDPSVLKLRRGIERFWFYPGRAEVRLYERFVELGLEVELYPSCDCYDLRVTFPDGEVWAIDLKDYSNPYLLAKRLDDEPIPPNPTWDLGYIVIPNERKRDRPAYLKELKSRWRWQNVKPMFDDAIFALAKKKLGFQTTESPQKSDREGKVKHERN